MMKFHGPCLLSLIFLLGCVSDPEIVEVSVNGKVKMLLPSSLTLSPKPNPDALLHYEDTIHSIYFLVIAESKDSMKAYEMDLNLNTYFNATCLDLNSRLSGAVNYGLKPETINGLAAFTGFVRGNSGKEKIMYSLATIESKKNFYQLVAAYPTDDSTRWKPVMGGVILSFREL